MMCSKYKKQLSTEKLKSFFFDLLTNETYGADYSKLYQQLVFQLKEMILAQSVSLYLFEKESQRFILETSTTNLINKERYEMSLEQWEKTIDGINLPNIMGSDQIWPQNNPSNCYMLFIKEPGSWSKLIGWYVFQMDDFFCEKDFNKSSNIISEGSSKLLHTWSHFYGHIIENSRFKQLYRVTSKFHSSMVIDDVLSEVISTLREVYPSFNYSLLLSHDNRNNKDLPIKDLGYVSNTSSNYAAEAYLTGSIQFENSHTDKYSVLYAPLKGKQGVYGVLEVIALNTLNFPHQEVSFIELLANTAGSALENAQLYQQSKRLVADLQLINKTSHRLNSNLRLTEIIKFMTDQIIESFHAKEVGFVLFLENNQHEVLPGSTTFFTSEKSGSFLQEGNKRIKAEKDSLFIGDTKSDKDFENELYRSLMAVPMIQSDELEGAVYVLHHDRYAFTFENFKLMQSLIHHSTLAFTNSILREELEKLVITDHLTQLKSRSYLDKKIYDSMKKEKGGSFLLIDIDNFKLVNDTFGHQIGDQIIIQVANLIKENIREMDIGARWGGEELAVYLPNIGIEVGTKIAKRLVLAVEKNTDPKITISCGLAYWKKDESDTVGKLFNRADQALYEAKNSGKNKVVIYKGNNK